MRILMVDDDQAFSKALSFLLRHEGYEVVAASSGIEALRAVEQQTFDMMILDVMLPSVDGFEVCKRIRQVNRLPIIMLSARGRTEDRVRGLLEGADDYVHKPCVPAELLARVKAVLRRSHIQIQTPSESAIISIGGLQLDPMRHAAVLASGKKVELTPTESRLLGCLMISAGKALLREELLTYAWGDTVGRDEGQVDVYIRRLRLKVEADPSVPRYIHTVWGSGYKFHPQS